MCLWVLFLFFLSFFLYIYIYIYIHIYQIGYIYIYIYIYVCVCVCVCVYAYIHWWIHLCMHPTLLLSPLLSALSLSIFLYKCTNVHNGASVYLYECVFLSLSNKFVWGRMCSWIHLSLSLFLHIYLPLCVGTI